MDGCRYPSPQSQLRLSGFRSSGLGESVEESGLQLRIVN